MPLKKDFEEVASYYESSAKAGDIEWATVKALKISFAKLQPYWDNKEPIDISKVEWEKYLDWYELKYPSHTQFNVKKFMGILLSHLLEKGLVSKRPSIRDRNAKRDREARKKKKSRVFTDDEIIALENACIDDMERLSLRLGYQMAYRISDVCWLSWERINLDSEVPYVNFSGSDDKAGFQGKTPISSDVLSILQDLKNKVPSNCAFVFPQKRDPSKPIKTQVMDSIWRKLKVRGGLSYGTFHSLRHYRLSRDFKNPAFTANQVCLMRRISMNTAEQHYIHAELSDLIKLKDSGSIENLRTKK